MAILVSRTSLLRSFALPAFGFLGGWGGARLLYPPVPKLAASTGNVQPAAHVAMPETTAVLPRAASHGESVSADALPEKPMSWVATVERICADGVTADAADRSRVCVCQPGQWQHRSSRKCADQKTMSEVRACPYTLLVIGRRALGWGRRRLCS